MHELTQYQFSLPDVEDWLSDDDRVLAFTVVDADGDTVDISGATVSWAAYERPYNDDPSNAVLSGSDSDVELVTDSRVDTAQGEWEVRVDGSATADLWGEYFHRPTVEAADGTSSSWRGILTITA